MAILETNFEFTMDKNTNCYFTFLDRNGTLIPLQCDTGASKTSISLLALTEDSFDYSKEKAERIEEELLVRQNHGEHKQIKGNNLAIELNSASGEKMFGFLCDMGEVSIGNATFQHFYYYFVPKNKTAFALLGNDFLHNCEYSHNIQGNIVVTKFDEDAYVRSHKNALTQAEIKSLIADVCEKVDVEESYNYSDDFADGFGV